MGGPLGGYPQGAIRQHGAAGSCCTCLMRRPRPSDRLGGPPLALPPWLDHLSERWWRLTPRWRAAIAIATVVAVVLAGVAHAAATPYGPPTTAYVAARDLPAGHVLESTDLRRTTWPRDLVPHDVLDRAGGRLAAALPEGSVATQRHLAEEGVAAALPPGQAAVPVPVDGLPELGLGSRVEVVGRDLHGHATVLARESTVVAIDATDVWFSVPAASAPEVAAAGASGLVTVVVIAP